MVDESKLVDDVLDWLERGGYVLEMRVARVLNDHRMVVDQGFAYHDPETGKEREGDVSALMDVEVTEDHWHMLDLMMECKNTTSPWIGFAGEHGGNGPWTAGSYMEIGCQLCRAMTDRFAALRRAAPDVYAITEKRASNAKDHAHDAVRQATSATLGKYPNDRWNGHPDPDIVSMLAVPIVVTPSPLVLCTLNATGSVTLDLVDRMNVAVPRLDTPDKDADGMEVLVIRESALEALVEDLRQVAAGARDEI